MKLYETGVTSPTFMMLIGGPGSGKSTWIKKFVSGKKNWVILSTDEVFEEWGKKEGLNYSEAFNKFKFKDVNAEFNKRLRKAFEEKKNVVWDQTNMTPKSRRGKLNNVPKDYKKVAVAFEVDDKEVDKRLVAREANSGKSIPSHVVASMRKSYNPPTKQEGFDEIKIIHN